MKDDVTNRNGDVVRAPAPPYSTLHIKNNSKENNSSSSDVMRWLLVNKPYGSPTVYISPIQN